MQILLDVKTKGIQDEECIRVVGREEFFTSANITRSFRFTVRVNSSICGEWPSHFTTGKENGSGSVPSKAILHQAYRKTPSIKKKHTRKHLCLQYELTRPAAYLSILARKKPLLIDGHLQQRSGIFSLGNKANKEEKV